jgi:hypothetical protein
MEGWFSSCSVLDRSLFSNIPGHAVRRSPTFPRCRRFSLTIRFCPSPLVLDNAVEIDRANAGIAPAGRKHLAGELGLRIVQDNGGLDPVVIG